jgi:long-subunit fatty acid transport protein
MKAPSPRTWSRALPLVAALGWAAPAAASVPDLFGYGARSTATAGALAASTEGHEAVYYSPANLGFESQRSFALGYQHASLSLDINGDDHPALDAPWLVIGFGIPVPLGPPLERRLAFGLGFVLPQTSILIADTKRPGELTFPLVENRAQTVSVQLATAVRVTDWLSLGWGLIALSELEGGIDVAPNETGKLGSKARDQLIASYANVASLALRPTPASRLAVEWRESSAAEYTLPIDADLGDSFNIPVPLLDITGTAQFDPAHLAVSGSYDFADQVLVGASFVYKWWSGFENPIRYTSVPPGYPDQPDPDFDDVLVARVGAEGRLRFDNADVTLRPRLGLGWEPSPAPEQKGLHNYLDNDRVVSGLGLGITHGIFTLDLVAQHQLLLSRTQQKPCDEAGRPLSLGPYPAGDGSGDPMQGYAWPSYPGPNPGCGTTTHSGSTFLLGAELGVRF